MLPGLWRVKNVECGYGAPLSFSPLTQACPIAFKPTMPTYDSDYLDYRTTERLPLEDRCLVKAYTRDVEPHKGKGDKKEVCIPIIHKGKERVGLPIIRVSGSPYLYPFHL